MSERAGPFDGDGNDNERGAGTARPWLEQLAAPDATASATSTAATSARRRPLLLPPADGVERLRDLAPFAAALPAHIYAATTTTGADSSSADLVWLRQTLLSEFTDDA